MNSDTKKGGRAERRYLHLGREDSITLPGEESWLEKLDAPSEEEDETWDEEKERRLVGDLLNDWEEDAAVLSLNLPPMLPISAQIPTASPSQDTSSTPHKTDRHEIEEPKEVQVTSSPRQSTPVGASNRSSSIWEDGEKFWASTPPHPPNSPNKSKQHFIPLCSSPISTFSPRTSKKRHFEVAKDEEVAAQEDTHGGVAALGCTNTGRKCDGYSKPGGDDQILSRDLSHAFDPYLSISTFSSFGGNVHYLEFYHYHARPAISSTFDNEFWTQTVLQIAASESAVRHALIALASLIETEDGTLKHARAVFTTHSGPSTLLYHYNKSIQCLVERFSDPSCQPEIGLVTCLLYICIEYLRGDYRTAFKHLRSGLGIIVEQRMRQRRTLPISTPPGSVRMEFGEVIQPASMIEDKLSPIYMRAVASALMFGELLEEVIEIPCPSPTSFRQQPIKNIYEAQCSSHELRNATLLFLRQIGVSLMQRGHPTTEDLKHQGHVLESQVAWYHALQQFEQIQALSKVDEVTIGCLKVTYFAIYSWTACATQITQTPFDAHLSHFRSIIHHARLVLNSTSYASNTPVKFAFEISVVPALFHVAVRCRCPKVRRQAVALLELQPVREGLWDAQQYVIVAKRVIEIEEEEVDPETGWPGEMTRVYATVVNGDMDCHGGFSVYFLPVKLAGVCDENGQQKIVHERFTL
ncbi:hypothetical protein N0V90_008899 [Kalmusia sp. IMI 367209]|nr:hypothetical protein N0V90_008899 [Kalmusia sp. IMI 367209]